MKIYVSKHLWVPAPITFSPLSIHYYAAINLYSIMFLTSNCSCKQTFPQYILFLTCSLLSISLMQMFDDFHLYPKQSLMCS